MSDLKPCPFCGGEATHDTDGSAIWVICKKCGARCTSSFFSGKKGVRIVDERWNRRALEAIVRCKDCEHFSTELERSDGTKCSWEWCCVRTVPTTSEDFCSWAERRTDDY